jgi:hypothetical protein
MSMAKWLINIISLWIADEHPEVRSFILLMVLVLVLFGSLIGLLSY